MPKRRFPDPGREFDPEWAQDLVRTLNQASVDDSAPKGVGYAVSNFTELRTLDASTATLQNTKDFIATLVQDLLNASVLKE